MVRLILAACLLLLGACTPFHPGNSERKPAISSRDNAQKINTPTVNTPTDVIQGLGGGAELSEANLRARHGTPQAVDHNQARLALAYYRFSQSGVTFSMAAFDGRDYQLRVADQQGGPGTRWTDAQSAAATYGGLAAINGGFFTPEGKPLGLLVETGSKRGYLNRSSLGAGVYIATHTGSKIIRREKIGTSTMAANAYNLLQTGPMLVENSKPISGLSKTSRRPRSFIAWDGKNHWAIGYAEPCTLDALSRSLARTSSVGFKIKIAVNLDGGRSSDLWVGPKVKHGNKTHRTLFNKTVRNYMVLIPR